MSDIPAPRPELVEAAVRRHFGDELVADPNCREEMRWVLEVVLPLLTPADVPQVEQAVREQIAEELRGKITDWEPTCSDRYIRGIRAALLYVTGEAHDPLFASGRERAR